MATRTWAATISTTCCCASLLKISQSEWGEDLSADSEGVQRLRRAVIKAKEELSFVTSARYRTRRTKAKPTSASSIASLFDRLIAPIIERTLEPCRACLADAKLTPEQIDEVVLVGGSTRIPLVRAAVETFVQSQAAYGTQS